jgi:taurine---2-oxoglutarate transaminase
MSAENHVVYGWQPQRVTPKACFVRSERIYLWDTDDRRFMDFCAGQMNVNVGYSHPRVLDAMRRQMTTLTYVPPTFETQPRTRLARMIAERAPQGLEYVFFANSGSEAVEMALKIARAVTGRTKIYSAWRSYHGTTAGASAISGDPRRLFVEPSQFGLGKFHGATCYCCPFGHRQAPECAFACLEALRSSLLLDGSETVAAIVLEPIVGTSGIYIPPVEFIRGVRELCTTHGIVLIFDETMTGWGRTGRWFACEHFGVSPDILVTAKGITSGYVPLGAAVMTARVRDFFLDRVFVGGLTNEGHALACATAIANIETYENEKLIERSKILGDYLLERLIDLKARHSSIGDIRGKGLFACIELTADRALRTPLAGYRNQRKDVASGLLQLLFDMRLILVAKWDYVFIAPPLVIEKDELDEGLSCIDKALYYADELATRQAS